MAPRFRNCNLRREGRPQRARPAVDGTLKQNSAPPNLVPERARVWLTAGEHKLYLGRVFAEVKKRVRLPVPAVVEQLVLDAYGTVLTGRRPAFGMASSLPGFSLTPMPPCSTMNPRLLFRSPSSHFMKEFYISDCARVENQTITSLFVVAAKQVKSKKNGELYLSMVLADRSGQLQANMWDNVNDAIAAFEQDDFVKVKGVIHKYNGRWQLTVHKMRKLGDSEIDYSDYLPKTSKDVEQLWRTLGEFVESFENPWLKSLLSEFIADEAIATPTRTRPRPRRCITPSSAACSTTWSRCLRCAIWRRAIIPRSIAICC